MAVSVRELFLIVRAQDQASRNLRFVGANLRGIASAAELANAKARAANRLSQIQLRQASQRLRIDDLAGNVAAQRNKLDEVGNKHLSTRVKSLRDSSAISEKINAQTARAMQLENALSRPGRLRGPGTRGLSRAAATAELAMARENLKGLDAAQAGVNQRVQQSAEAFDKQSRAVSHASISHQRAINSLQAMGMASNDAAKHIREIEVAERQLKWRNMGNTGRALSNLGRSMQFVGGVGVAALGFAANSAANFSKQTQLAATQASSTLAGIGRKNVQIQKTVLAQMQQFPATADEMSQSLYDIFSGTNVQKVSQGGQLLKIFNKAAVAGQASLNDVTQAGISVLNTYGLKVSQMPAVMNKFFAAVRFGRMNVTQFTQSFNQLVPAFESAHQSIGTMFGSMAFLTRMMPSQRMAAVGLARGIELLSGGPMVDGLKKVGVHVTDIHDRLLPLPVVLDKILQKFPRLGKDQNVGNFIKDISNQQGTIQARRALTFLFRDFGKYKEMLRSVNGDQGEFTRSFSALASTAGNKWAVMLNKLKVLWLQLGRAALPPMLDLSEKILVVVNALNRLNNATQGSIGQWLVYGAALTVLLGVFTQIVGVWQAAIGTLGMFATSLGLIGAEVETIGAGTAGVEMTLFSSAGLIAALPAIAAVAAGLGALAAAIYLVDKYATSMTPHLDAIRLDTKDLAKQTKLGTNAMSAATVAQGNLNNARARIPGLQAAIGQDKKVLADAKKGTMDYNLAVQQLTADQQALAAANQMVAQSNKALQSSLHGVSVHANSQAGQLADIHRNLGGVRHEIKQFGLPSLNAQLPPTGEAAFGAARFAGKAEDNKKALADLGRQIVKTFNANEGLAASFNHLVARGLNPFTKSATSARMAIEKNRNALLGFMPDMSQFANKLVKGLGAIPGPNFMLQFRRMPDVVRQAVVRIAKDLHQIPTQRTINFLVGHQNIAPAVSAIIGKLKRMPTKKEIHILLQHKSVDAQIASFIQRHKKLPTIKQIVQMEVKQKAKDKRIQQQFQGRVFKAHMNIDTGAANRKLDTTNKKLKGLKNVTKKVHYNITPANPAGQGQKVGAAIASGIAAGISGGQGAIVAAAQGAVNVAIQAGISAAKAKSPSQVSRDKIGKPIGQGIAVGMLSQIPNIHKAAHKVAHAAAGGDGATRAAFLHRVSKTWIKNLQEAGITLFASGAFKGKLDDHAQKIAKQMGVFLTKNHTWTLAGEGIGRLIANGISRGLIKQAGGKAALKTIVDTMASTFSDIKSSLTDSFGGIFQGTEQNQGLQTIMGFGGKVPFSAVKGDLAAQLHQFDRWTHALRRLRHRGIPGALYQQLLAAGPASLPAVLALANATKPQLRQYEHMFKREQHMIAKQTRAAFGVQMKIWKDMGKNMAFGILTGLKTESPAIISWLRHLAKKMFYQVKHHNKSHSPSKLYAEEGRNMLRGLEIGMQHHTPQFAWGNGAGGGGGGHHVHYHYNQTLHRGNQSDAAFMRKARFHFESRIPRQ